VDHEQLRYGRWRFSPVPTPAAGAPGLQPVPSGRPRVVVHRRSGRRTGLGRVLHRWSVDGQIGLRRGPKTIDPGDLADLARPVMATSQGMRRRQMLITATLACATPEPSQGTTPAGPPATTPAGVDGPPIRPTVDARSRVGGEVRQFIQRQDVRAAMDGFEEALAVVSPVGEELAEPSAEVAPVHLSALQSGRDRAVLG
jgi:hypothetical protein